jgi:hypothetical protein
MVRAKFYVSTLTKQKMGQGSETGTLVKLNPVVTGSDENKEFYRYTPSGSIEIGILNEKTAEMFEIGKEYYIDFTPAE